jgi:hypothetical protein
MYDTSLLFCKHSSHQCRITATRHNDMSLPPWGKHNRPHHAGTPHRRAIYQTSCDRSGLASNVEAHALSSDDAPLVVAPWSFHDSWVNLTLSLTGRGPHCARTSMTSIATNRYVCRGRPSFAERGCSLFAVINLSGHPVPAKSTAVKAAAKSRGERGGQSFAILSFPVFSCAHF